MDWRKRNTTARLSACITLMLAAGCAGVVGHKHGERPDCVCFPRGACAGYYSTCWRLWPEECVSCPVSGGPVMPGDAGLPGEPFTAPAGESTTPANEAGPGELITPPEPPKIHAPLSPPDAAGSRTIPAAPAPSKIARAPSSARAQPVASGKAAPVAEPKPASRPNLPSRPVIKSFTASPTNDVAAAPMTSAAPTPTKNIAAPAKGLTLPPAKRTRLDAPAMPAAWEERVTTTEFAAPRPQTAPSRPIVAAAPRRQTTATAPYIAREQAGFAAAIERRASRPAPTSSASKPIVSTPPRQVPARIFDERRVATTRSQPSPVVSVRPPLGNPAAEAATRPAATAALAELWTNNAPPRRYLTDEEAEDRAALRIVSEVRPLPPVQPRPVVHSVEKQHDSIVVRDDRIEKLPAIEAAPPVRAPARPADGPPVVRPALRR